MAVAIKQALSPQSPTGSVLASIMVHLILAGTVVAAVTFAPSAHEAPADQYVDLGYETFDAPPEPTKTVQHVKTVQSEEIVKTKAPIDNSPHELQDEKGDVAGTQTAAAKPVGSEGTGTAATTPYYKIKPKYPHAALVAGTEGWVLMKVDVTETGEVENIRVIDGQEKAMFQDEARRAVRQWKYRPFLDANGKAIRKTDHEVRVDFKIAEQEADSKTI